MHTAAHDRRPARPARIIIFRLLLIAHDVDVSTRREHNRGGIYRVTGTRAARVVLPYRHDVSTPLCPAWAFVRAVHPVHNGRFERFLRARDAPRHVPTMRTLRDLRLGFTFALLPLLIKINDVQITKFKLLNRYGRYAESNSA